MVRSVGPAGKAGIQVGDRIITIDGKNVEKLKHDPLANLIKSKKSPKFTVIGYEMDPQNQERDDEAKLVGQKILTPFFLQGSKLLYKI